MPKKAKPKKEKKQKPEKPKKPKAEKQKKAKQKKAKAVSYLPEGYRNVAPSLSVSDAKGLMQFCVKVFGAKARPVMTGPAGEVMHAEVEIGDSVVMMSDPVMEAARPGNVMVYVTNVDKTVEKAVKAGAKVLMPVEDQFWGDRFGRIEDPFGNRWGVATHIEDVTPKEMKKRMANLKPPG